MDKETRNLISSTTQAIRRLLEEEFDLQLEGTFDVHADGRIADQPGSQLSPAERLVRRRIVEAIQHRLAVGQSAAQAVHGFLTEAVFTCFNRLAALKLMEGRGLVQPCVSRGDQSQGFKEFSGLAPGLIELPDKGYRLYLESLFDEIGREVGVLFDRTDAASLLWPRRKALEAVLDQLNTPDLATVWAEDETIGWIYQYFNDEAERKKMREESSAPRNSRELAVRNQFFTPRYVVEFLTDNTLGRLWYEMTRGETVLRERCRYLVRRPTEIFLKPGESAPESAASGEAENLSQEELLREPVHIPHRPLKDPREIRLLDPACGSMHFGLYAFDLFTVIYDEAWEIAHGADDAAKSAESFAPFVTFAATFPDKAAFLREVPRLIVERNIHGIDIDPRAAQIAGLSLWLRAQRAWHQAGVKAADRPRITRSNLVCAEPMPGEKELLREFVEQQFPAGERPAFAFLLETIFDCMTLAGEAGSLLRIEEEIRTAIADAKRLWKEGPKAEQASLFAEPGEKPGQGEMRLDLSGITDEQFWERAEQRIYDALEAYAGQAENGGGFQRRLFADDAAQGFAFIDLCRKRYDVALMNPPFGEGIPATRDYFANNYPTAARELATCFVERGAALTGRAGVVGAITSRFMLANDGVVEWRRDEFLDQAWGLQVFADLGYGVLDAAMVEACSYIVGSHTNQGIRPFINCLNDEDKGGALLTCVESLLTVPNKRVALRQIEAFRKVPDYIICYSLPDPLLNAVLRLPNLQEQGSAARVGLQTGDNERFARATWEIDPAKVGVGNEWCLFAKGGEYEPFYDDLHLVVFWKDDGYLLKNFFGPNGKLFSRPQNLDFYFREGITYPDRTTSDFSPRFMPEGVVFSSTGFALFPPTRAATLGYLGAAYSRPYKILVEAFVGSGDSSVSGSAARHYRPGILNLLPNLLPNPSAEIQKAVGECIRRRIATFRLDETTRYFDGIPGLQALTSVRQFATDSYLRHFEDVVFLIDQNFQIEHEVDRALGISDKKLLDENYGVHPATLGDAAPVEDGRKILDALSMSEEGIVAMLVQQLGAGRSVVKKSYFADRSIELICKGFGLHPRVVIEVVKQHNYAPAALVREAACSVISLAVGAVLGRWDIRYAAGERQAPELPDPFAPLPVCPPGMLQGDDGLPLSPEAGRRLRTEGRYPLDVAWDGILVDDPDHPADIVGRVQEVLRVLWKDRSDAIEHEACELLGVKSLKDWFRKPTAFFADHLARYSKSRRQAPIYWPLSSPNGLYTVWLYYHRLTADTLFTVLRDYLKPKLEFEERQAFQLRQEAGTTPSPSQRRDTAEAEELVEDLRAFKAELERVAPLFRPNLNDGVIINYAPLWRMIGLPKWRKDCQAVWTELAKGDYDWAHLALHLWPERVVPKCATDRSLAIAHGLEAVFWQEDPEKPGKWIARKVTDLELRGLIAERTSAAVKAAVEELSSGQQQGSEASSAGRRKTVGARRGKKASGQEDLL